MTGSDVRGRGSRNLGLIRGGRSQKGWRGGLGVRSKAGKWSEREPRPGKQRPSGKWQDPQGRGSPAEESGEWTLKSPRTTTGVGGERDEDQERSLQETRGALGRGVTIRDSKLRLFGEADRCASAQEGDKEAHRSPRTAVHRAERKAGQPGIGGRGVQADGGGERVLSLPRSWGI